VITVQKILFLRNVPLFSGMPPGDLSYLAGIAEEVVYSAGEAIIRQGDHGDTMFLIVEGDVRVHRGEAQLAVLTSKDYFGEMSILDGEPRSASVTALTDCLLLRINQADFHDILSQHFKVALAIIQTLTRRLRETESSQSAGPASVAPEEEPR
jgi:CRP-like cAMP-binding protein